MPLTADDFDYFLPPERIAQHPLAERDRSRLMVLRRGAGRIEHRVFAELPDLLTPGDLLVLNDTRVVPARFFCRRVTGGRVEGLFLREIESGRWEALLKRAGRCGVGERLTLLGAGEAELELLESSGQGRWTIAVRPPVPAVELLERVGAVPLPPYIRREQHPGDAADREEYQTVYANRPGAAAAPTAGLHFTDRLMERLDQAGVETASVTLHVGPGTFAPVKTDRLDAHEMHAEWYELTALTAGRLNDARRAGRRIVAVGTTSVRVLESACDAEATFRPRTGWTDIFIYPPHRFRAVDALITNFHLPRSTLVMLVAAFCSPGGTDGVATILDAYRTAVEAGYRFYSYGDAMLIV